MSNNELKEEKRSLWNEFLDWLATFGDCFASREESSINIPIPEKEEKEAEKSAWKISAPTQECQNTEPIELEKPLEVVISENRVRHRYEFKQPGPLCVESREEEDSFVWIEKSPKGEK